MTNYEKVTYEVYKNLGLGSEMYVSRDNKFHL